MGTRGWARTALDNLTAMKATRNNAALYAQATQAGLSDAVNIALPPGSLVNEAGCVPALSDNGDSRGSGCSKSLNGAILSTLRREDAGSIAVGEDSASLTSLGTCT